MCSCHICHTKIAASPLHPLEHNALLHRNKSPILADFRYIYVKVFLPEDTINVPRDEEDATKCSSFVKCFPFPYTNRKNYKY